MQDTQKNPHRLLNRRQVEAEYGIPIRFLERSPEEGPMIVRLGRSVFYRACDVEKWIEAHLDSDGS